MLLEEPVPAWDRANPRTGQIERAVLDLEVQAAGMRQWIDVTVRHPAAGSAKAMATASKRIGEASRRAERGKHDRYPGDQLIAFAVEILGHIGGEARMWMGELLDALPNALRSLPLSGALMLRRGRAVIAVFGSVLPFGGVAGLPRLTCGLQRMTARQLLERAVEEHSRGARSMRLRA